MARLVLVVCSLFVLGVSVSASALDARKTAAALAARAAKAYEAGNLSEAAGLYRDAYQVDPKEPAYLYGAARAAHTAHDLAHAEKDYVAYLANKDVDPARARKAVGYLTEVRAELSAQKTTEAQTAASGGDAVLAVSLYLEAWRIAPENTESLLRAAMLERKLGDKAAAVEHLRKYLEIAPPTATGRGTAQALLAELSRPPVVQAGTERTPAAESPKPEKPVVTEAPKPEKPVVVPPLVSAPTPIGGQPTVAGAVSASHASTVMSGRRVAGWATIGIGGVGVVVAGILAGVAQSEQSTLDANRLPSGNFDGRKISVADAASAQTSINSKWTGMGIAAGVGAAAIGVGAVLIATDRADVTVVPNLTGFSLAGRF